MRRRRCHRSGCGRAGRPQLVLPRIVRPTGGWFIRVIDARQVCRDWPNYVQVLAPSMLLLLASAHTTRLFRAVVISWYYTDICLVNLSAWKRLFGSNHNQDSSQKALSQDKRSLAGSLIFCDLFYGGKGSCLGWFLQGDCSTPRPRYIAANPRVASRVGLVRSTTNAYIVSLDQFPIHAVVGPRIARSFVCRWRSKLNVATPHRERQVHKTWKVWGTTASFSRILT